MKHSPDKLHSKGTSFLCCPFSKQQWGYKKSSSTYLVSCMPGNSSHTSMFFQAHANIEFKFPPHLGCENETSLQWKCVCTKNKYLTPSSALVKLLGKISPGKGKESMGR